MKLRKIWWYLILALPLFIYLLSSIHQVATFDNVMSNFVPSGVTNVVKDTLLRIFQNADIFQSLSDGVLNYFVYVVAIELLHILLDVLLFIPKLLHACFDRLNGSTKGDM